MDSVSRQIIEKLLSWSKVEGTEEIEGRVSFQFDSTKGDIATLLGVSRVDATDVLNNLKSSGIIDIQGSTIIIFDPTALEKMIS